MRRKDYFRARKCFGYLLLGSDPEQAPDEPRLPSRVTAVQPFDLPLLHHVRRFNPFYCPLGRVEGAEALHRPPPLANGSMVLFDHVVEVFDAPQLTVTWQDSLFY